MATVLVLLAATAVHAGPVPGEACVAAGVSVHGLCEAWVADWDGADGLEDGAGVVVPSPDGARALVASTSQTEGPGDLVELRALDAATGATVWTTGLGPAGGPRFADLAVAGDAVVAAGSIGGTLSSDLLVAAFALDDGALRWVRTLDLGDGRSDWGVAASAGAAGAVWVAARSFEGGRPDHAVARYASDGELTDVHILDGAGVGAGEASSTVGDPIHLAPAHGRAFALHRGDGGGTGARVAAWDLADGRLVWSAAYRPASFSAWPHDVSLSPDGATVLVTGTAEPVPGDRDYRTVAYDAETGKATWSALFDGAVPRVGTSDFGWFVEASPDGARAYVTGLSVGGVTGVDDDYGTVAYDLATGAELWRSRFDGRTASFDDVHAMAVAPQGDRVYLTGVSTFNVGGLATVALDAATGKEAWHVLYHDGDEAVPNASPADVAVSPDGGLVLVAGRDTVSPRVQDALVLAYDRDLGRVLT